jgi:UDP-N-acetylglucosamine 1-carboxyvinyltransferase
MIALAVRAEGTVMFWNKVYEGGFTWMSELSKFGAHIVVSDPHRITVFGAKPLRPATVEAPYIIRAAVALYMVAASIPGKSVVKNADTIKRATRTSSKTSAASAPSVEWK